MDLVSVIIPCYHVEDYIAECIESIINQSYDNLEIICVNDFTMDNTFTIVKEYKKNDDRIKVVSCESNRGLGGARNVGIENATGKYVIFIDSDDSASNVMVEELHNNLIVNNSDLSMCDINLVPDNHVDQPFHSDFSIEGNYIIDENSIHNITNIYPSAWNKIYKKEIIDSHSLKFPEKLLFEDHEFFYKYIYNSKKISYLSLPLYNYRTQREGQITSTVSERIFEIFDVINHLDIIFDDFFRDKSEIEKAKISLRLLWERLWTFRNTEDITYYDTFIDRSTKVLKKYFKKGYYICKDPFIPIEDLNLLSKRHISFSKERKIKLLMKTFIKKRIYGSISNSLKKSQFIKMAIFRLVYGNLKVSKYIIYEIFMQNKILNDHIHYISNDIKEMILHQELSERVDEIIHKSKKELYSEVKKELNPVIESELRPVIEGELRPVIEGELRPVIEGELRPVIEGELRPVIEGELRPVIEGELRLVIESELRPVIESELYNKVESKIKTECEYDINWQPSWYPEEYKKFFTCNVWLYADNFKKYNVNMNKYIEKKMEMLLNGLSFESKQVVNTMWFNYINVIPKKELAEKHAFKFNRDIIFSSEMRDKQYNIVNTFKNSVSKYKIPSSYSYEIPVFHYHHGLQGLPKLYHDYIKNSDILDIGAYIGDSALILDEYKPRKLVMIEANKDYISTIEDTLKMNDVSSDNKILINCAVGERDIDNIDFILQGSSSHIGNNEGIISKIDQSSIDTLCKKYELDVKFLKMDIEGAELSAIKGAKNTILNCNPILSISVYHTPEDLFEIKPLLESWGLEYNFIFQDHNPFDPVYEKVLLCVPKI